MDGPLPLPKSAKWFPGKKVVPLDTSGLMPYIWVSEALDLTQMVMDIQKQLKITIFIMHNRILFQQNCQKVIPWDTPGSITYSWLSGALGLTQMVMNIQKQLEITIFIITNNLCFNKIAKKSFPGTPRGQCPTLGCPRLWTLPRWSWTSGKNVKQLL